MNKVITAVKNVTSKTFTGIRTFFSKFGLALIISLLVIAVGTVSYLAYTLNSSLDQTKNDLQAKSADLQSLQAALNQTEEGRKQLEAANKTLGAKATSAEKEADKANEQLDDANKDLKAQEAKLAQVNAQLTKAKRGIALFDSAKSYYNNFVKYMGLSVGYVFAIQEAQSNGDDATANHYLDLLEASAAKVDYYDAKLNSVFSKLKSGKY